MILKVKISNGWDDDDMRKIYLEIDKLKYGGSLYLKAENNITSLQLELFEKTLNSSLNKDNVKLFNVEKNNFHWHIIVVRTK